MDGMLSGVSQREDLHTLAKQILLLRFEDNSVSHIMKRQEMDRDRDRESAVGSLRSLG